MTGGYWVDSGQVRSAGRGFTDLGERLGEILQNLQSALAAEGNCWGNDAYGKAFEKDYLPGRQRPAGLFRRWRDPNGYQRDQALVRSMHWRWTNHLVDDERSGEHDLQPISERQVSAAMDVWWRDWSGDGR